jgi:cysteine desulfuration protein SufE
VSEAVALPPKLAEIVADFELMEGREKLELLLEYANRFPPFPAHLVLPGNVEDVPECMTPVQMMAEKQGDQFIFHFDVPAESPTVRGYASLVMEGVNGSTREEILAIPAEFYLRMGLQDVLTPQRLNGMAAILAHVKRSVVSM